MSGAPANGAQALPFVVLGARGFMGTAIAKEAAARGHAVVPAGSAEIDLRQPTAGQSLGGLCSGAVLVFAAGRPRLYSDSYQTLLDNLAMVQTVVTAATVGRPRAVVFLGSVEVYGAPAHLPVTETTPFAPGSLYASGKITAELMLERMATETGIPVVLLRLPGVYGDTERKSIVGRLIAAAREDTPFRLQGPGHDLRDYVHVGDLASVVVSAGRQAAGTQRLNVATGHSSRLVELVAAVEGVFGRCRIETEPSSGFHFDLVFDTAALRAAVPDVRFRSVEEALIGIRDNRALAS